MTLTPEVVYQVILGVTKVDNSEREHSEALLKKWEKDATPGCLDSLMQIATQVANISEVGLLAVSDSRCIRWICVNFFLFPAPLHIYPHGRGPGG